MIVDEVKGFYKNMEEFLRDYPMFDSKKDIEDFNNYSNKAKKENREVTIHWWGFYYMSFYLDGSVSPFEHEEINENGSLADPPKGRDEYIFRFEFHKG